MNKRFAKQNTGFTLIELMIAVAILGIIMAIAIPNYRDYVSRSHRIDARNALQAAAQKLEQNYSAKRRYDEDSSGNAIDNGTLAAWGLSQSPASGTRLYTIEFEGDKPASATEYTLKAIPDPNGAQKNDECGTFTLNQSNVRTAAGAGPRDDKSRSCWTR